MNNTALFARLSRPATPTRKGNPTRNQLLLCLAGLVLLGASLWTLARMGLTDTQFVFGMLVSVVVSLAVVGTGFVFAARANAE
ncbi:MAG: hypothetical protein HY301_03390 [Verrucomicrobia bacterium]|nr:hypothetical protein [Verrucomicrobiota bacterium]